MDGQRIYTGCILVILSCVVLADAPLTGKEIMTKMAHYSRQSPYGYEKQTMVLMDEAGNRDVRKLRRYLRLESDGTAKHLLIFDYPAEVRGVSLLAILHSSGERDSSLYLPAFGKHMKLGAVENRATTVLGTDFSIDDLNFDQVGDFIYSRMQNQQIDEVSYYVVEAISRESSGGYGMRHLYIRQDNHYLSRIDYYDHHKNLIKRQTHHDLVLIGGDIWRANMILMENFKAQHKTLIKIDQRIFSISYVPEEVFTRDWIQQQEGATGNLQEEPDTEAHPDPISPEAH